MKKEKKEQEKRLNITAYYEGYAVTESLTKAEAEEKYKGFTVIEEGDDTLVVASPELAD